MKPKILVLGSSSFSGASMVKYLLDKNKYRVYGTFRRKKISSYLPYKFSKNFRLFKEYKIDFSKNSIQLLNLVFQETVLLTGCSTFYEKIHLKIHFFLNHFEGKSRWLSVFFFSVFRNLKKTFEQNRKQCFYKILLV